MGEKRPSLKHWVVEGSVLKFALKCQRHFKVSFLGLSRLNRKPLSFRYLRARGKQTRHLGKPLQ